MDYVLNLWVRLGTDLYNLFLAGACQRGAPKLILDVLIILVLVILGVLAVIVLTPMERKVIARMQDRPGPKPGGGLMAEPGLRRRHQDVDQRDDLAKRADRLIYTAAPILIVIPALMTLCRATVRSQAADAKVQLGATNLNVGVLYFVALGSVASNRRTNGRWGSNNKFALLGAFRVVNQLIAYEVPNDPGAPGGRGADRHQCHAADRRDPVDPVPDRHADRPP